MYVKVLTCDGEITEHHQHNLTEAMIENAINRLDGREYTMVVIGGEPPTHLAIGGGGSGRYIVYATFDNMRFFNLIGNPTLEGSETLFIGGQPGDYPRNTIVSHSQAVAVAITFSCTGRLDSDFGWSS
jgi:Immunity protein Imm1